MTASSARTMHALIYGSCVSRDTFEYLDQERFELTRYIARQSLISAFSEPTDLTANALDNLASEFQKRTLTDDFQGSLRANLAAFGTAVDLILWDITDERFGVYEVQPGRYVTRSLELVASGLDAAYAIRHPLIRYGSRRHLHLWTAAALRFAEALDELAPDADVVLVAPRWASQDAAGKPTRSPITDRKSVV